MEKITMVLSRISMLAQNIGVDDVDQNILRKAIFGAAHYAELFDYDFALIAMDDVWNDIYGHKGDAFAQ